MVFALGLALFGGAMWGWLHVRAFRTAMHLFGVAVFVDFLSLSLVAIGMSDYPKWRALTREDGAVEWATVFVLVIAAGLYFFRAASNRPARDKLVRLSELTLGLFCAFVAGEEISWGQRLFGFVPPKFFLEKNAQQEFNLHNFFNHLPVLGDGRFESGDVMVAVALVFGALLPLAAIGLRWRVIDRVRAVIPPVTTGSLLVLSAAVYAWSPLAKADEVAEFLFAIGLLLAALDRDQDPTRRRLFDAAAVSRSSSSPRASAFLRGASALMLPVVLAMGIVYVIDSVSHATDDEKFKLATSEAKTIAENILSNSAARRKAAINKRVYTAVQAGYLVPDDKWTFLNGKRSPAEDVTKAPSRAQLPLAEDRRGYFLDPWNYPYWVQLFPRLGKVIVYSFGPNQRRDFDRFRPKAPEGDDVVVRMRFPEKKQAEIRLDELFPGIDFEGTAKRARGKALNKEPSSK